MMVIQFVVGGISRSALLVAYLLRIHCAESVRPVRLPRPRPLPVSAGLTANALTQISITTAVVVYGSR
jgi:hypothetical protein